MALAQQASGAADGSLAQRAVAGESAAFEAIYQRFSPRLLRFFQQRVRDRSAAEDLVQETMLRVLAYLPTFDRSRPMWPWLKAIASHLCVDRRGEGASLVPGDLGEAADPSRTLESVEERDLLAQALRRVPRRERIALGLRYLEDWDISAAAAFLGLDRNAYDQLLFRARRRLRTEYRRLVDGLRGLLPLPGLRWIRGRIRRGFDWVQSLLRSNPANTETINGLSVASSGVAVAVAGIAAVVILSQTTILGGGMATTETRGSSRPSGGEAVGDAALNIQEPDSLSVLPVSSEAEPHAGSSSVKLPGGGRVSSGEEANRQASDPEGDRVETPPFGEPEGDDCECTAVATNLRSWLKAEIEEWRKGLEAWRDWLIDRLPPP